MDINNSFILGFFIGAVIVTIILVVISRFPNNE
jgi:hypothetical protein